LTPLQISHAVYFVSIGEPISAQNHNSTSTHQQDSQDISTPHEDDLNYSENEVQDVFDSEDDSEQISESEGEVQNVVELEDETYHASPLFNESQEIEFNDENEPHDQSISDTEYSTDTETSTSDTEAPIFPKPNYSHNFKKIYDGSDLSICAFNCCIMQLATKHSLTYDAISDILDLFSFACPKPNLVPNSLYKFKKFFNQYKNKSSNDIYCTNCHQLKKNCGCVNPSPGHLISICIQKPLESILNGKLITFIASQY